jgi:hypothetical protein
VVFRELADGFGDWKSITSLLEAEAVVPTKGLEVLCVLLKIHFISFQEIVSLLCRFFKSLANQAIERSL